MTAGEERTSADPVLETAPTDDVGAQTLARFRYQTNLAAATCIALVVDDRVKAVICEWHEDYVIQWANGPSELVSVKHHEPNQVNWTVAQLCADGGLKHLFNRFVMVNENCTCRLQTNEHLRTGAVNPAALRDACTNDGEEETAKWAEVLAPHLETDDIERVKRFLRVLTIEDARPNRNDVELIHQTQLMPDLMSRLGIADIPAADAYEAIRSLVQVASTAPARETVIEALADPDALSADAQRARLLATKTIDRARVLDAIRRYHATPTVLLAVAVDPVAPRSRLVKKLEAGGFGTTAINGARRLRASWGRHESTWSSGLPGDEDLFEHLRTRIVVLAGQAEGRVRVPGERYGVQMCAELEQLIQASTLGLEGRGPLSNELLLGLAYDRTDACEIFWCDPFNPDLVA